MKLRNLVSITSVIIVLGYGNNVVYGDDSGTSSPICSVVEKMLTERTLDTVLVARVSSKKEEFQVDIDNDGEDETLTFMPTRTYGALTDITDGKRIALPTGEPSGTYSDGTVIKIGEKNYILHSHRIGNSNLMELSPPKAGAYNYDYKVLCSFEQK